MPRVVGIFIYELKMLLIKFAADTKIGGVVNSAEDSHTGLSGSPGGLGAFKERAL